MPSVTQAMSKHDPEALSGRACPAPIRRAAWGCSGKSVHSGSTQVPALPNLLLALPALSGASVLWVPMSALSESELAQAGVKPRAASREGVGTREVAFCPLLRLALWCFPPASLP